MTRSTLSSCEEAVHWGSHPSIPGGWNALLARKAVKYRTACCLEFLEFGVDRYLAYELSRIEE